MSNPIRRAIDNSLSSLKVTDCDVNSIMARIRQEAQPRRLPRPGLRFTAVMAAVLALMVVSGTAVMLLNHSDRVIEQIIPLSQGLEENMALDEGQVRLVLDIAEKNGIGLSEETLRKIEDALETYGSYPLNQLIEDVAGIGDGGVEHASWPNNVREWYNDVAAALSFVRINEAPDLAKGELTKEAAVDLAKAFILTVVPSEPLNNASRYEVAASFNHGASKGYDGSYWNVAFKGLDRYVTEYDLDISATGDAVYRCDIQRGVGMGHTAEEIRAGLDREFPADMALWSQEQLSDYVTALRSMADPLSLFSTEQMFLATEYPSIADDAISREQAADIARSALNMDGGNGDRVEAVVHIGDAPNPVWKVSICEDRELDGYGQRWLRCAEIDSITGEVKYVGEELYDSQCRHMYFLHTAHDGTAAAVNSYINPMVPRPDAQLKAASYIQSHFGEKRNVNDAALFTLRYREMAYPATNGFTQILNYQSNDPEQTGYWVCFDGYGQILLAGTDERNTLDGVLMEMGSLWPNEWELQKMLGERVSLNGNPLVRLFLATRYLDFLPEEAAALDNAVAEWFGLRRDFVSMSNSVGVQAVIDAEPYPIYKAWVKSTKGNFLMEVESTTNRILSAVQIKDTSQPWYARYLLFSDLESVGLAITPYTPPKRDGKVVYEGIRRGMTLDDILRRFKDLYGCDPADWSQAQLRSFKTAISESWSLNTELSIPCILATEYPDVPYGAISKEDAAAKGAAALGLADYLVEGGVLLGGDPNPVWKITYSVGTAYYAAEVDCRTGEVKVTGAYRFDDGNMNSYWFEGIVPEGVIDVVRPQFTYEGNG